MPIRNLVFDIDDCLAFGSNEDIRQEWIPLFSRRFNLPAEEALRLNNHYFASLGCSATGFAQLYKVENPAEYVEQMYAEVAEYSLARVVARLAPSPTLPDVLQRLKDELKYRFFTFTQGHPTHANGILEHLGIAGFFPPENRFDRVRTYNRRTGKPASKRDVEAYQLFQRETGITFAESVMLEDTAANLKAAHLLGMVTVLVGDHAAANTDSFVHHRYPTVEAFLAAQLLHRVAA